MNRTPIVQTASRLQQNIRDILLLLAPLFLLFLIGRIALLLLYPSDFADLSLWERLRAMLLGALHFDISITFTAMALPLWLHLFAFRWSGSLLWRRFLLAWMAVVLIVFTFTEIVDIVYFGFVHRHIGQEMMASLQSDPELIQAIALQSYGWLLALFAGGVMLLILLTYRIAKQLEPRPPMREPAWSVRLPLTLLTLGLAILGIRGSAVSKPIQPVYAFEDSSMAAGYLELNGAFCTFHALHGPSPIRAHFMDDQSAKVAIRQALTSPHEQFIDAHHLLLRHRKPLRHPVTPPNIVVLLLESWDALHTDISRQLEGMQPYGVTPNFNRLAQQGLFLANFYANGQRSIDAITALLTGLPPQPGQRYLGEGVELNRFTWLGQMAKRHGYHTVMMQGSRRASFYLDKIAPLAGFDRYDGAEDLIPTLHPQVKKPTWGGWDLDLLETAHRAFIATKKPFLGFLFTVSTHTPFELPDAKWQKFPPDSEDHKLLNAMQYTDDVLGRFFAEAKQAGYMDNTIFFLVGDHYSGLGTPRDLRDQHHIPALIIAPGLTPRISRAPASQEDLIPTLMDLAGWSDNHATLGQSIIESHLNRGEMIRRDNLVGRIETDAFMMHDLHRPIFYQGATAKRTTVEQRLLAITQYLNHALLTNSLLPPPQ